MIVESYTLASSTAYATPYYVIRGELPGPVFMVVSGIHGNETGSIRAAQIIVERFNQRRLYIHRGTIIVVPLMNQKAYRKRIRGVPDLNRTFPRSSKTAAKHPLASALLQLVLRYRPTWFLDLHEANGLSQKNPKRLGQSIIVTPGSRGTGTAKRVIKGINRTIPKTAYHFNIRLRERPGSSRAAVTRILGAKAFTVETCWSLDRELRIRYQIDIVSRFLKSAGLL
ncbi:succinylglutamate desuccinylase/aspartoacylase family protein [Paenibacillus sp. FSL R5-0887]|jgi:predicted deacylase|uniref:M99 family carboxypeptidase catalytic domain-containing protein n=1 Tax=Paenibacillus TaxID=44249 RepID=UPI00096FC87B|nr:succinylglutamate desuccinylase/aspartoacylase family protein [Paenibacillus odorifer]OMC70023.1 deacylase [Paenibacillus odorifer]OMD94927.1 deacylase [Paenibacillus odorifer]OMD96755.1 deacylase [Paenibacillus odorifer]OME07616.1 deacylase [Paenibacillus odorifer]